MTIHLSPNAQKPPSVPDQSFTRIWAFLIQPHPAIQEPQRRRRARLLSSILIGLILAANVSIILTLVMGTDVPTLWIESLGSGLLALTFGISRTRRYRRDLFSLEPPQKHT